MRGPEEIEYWYLDPDPDWRVGWGEGEGGEDGGEGLDAPNPLNPGIFENRFGNPDPNPDSPKYI